MKNPTYHSISNEQQLQVLARIAKLQSGNTRPVEFKVIMEVSGDAMPVHVKFADMASTSLSVRRRDLFFAEQAVMNALIDADIPSLPSWTRQIGDGMFLFKEEHLPNDAEHVFQPLGTLASTLTPASSDTDLNNWTALSYRLAEAKLLSPQEADQLIFLDCFCQMIGHQHRGKDDLVMVQDQNGSERSWNIAPVGGLYPSFLKPQLNTQASSDADKWTVPSLENKWLAAQPSILNEHVWGEASILAKHFWFSLAEDVNVSQPMRDLAARTAQQIELPESAQRPVIH